jgi:hypothetical protein
VSDLRASTSDGAASVTLSDGTDDPNGPFAYLQVGGGGIVTANTMRGQLVSWTVPAGGYVWCAIRRVHASGTTATLIVGHQGMPYDGPKGI